MASSNLMDVNYGKKIFYSLHAIEQNVQARAPAREYNRERGVMRGSGWRRPKVL